MTRNSKITVYFHDFVSGLHKIINVYPNYFEPFWEVHHLLSHYEMTKGSHSGNHVDLGHLGQQDHQVLNVRAGVWHQWGWLTDAVRHQADGSLASERLASVRAPFTKSAVPSVWAELQSDWSVVQEQAQLYDSLFTDFHECQLAEPYAQLATITVPGSEPWWGQVLSLMRSCTSTCLASTEHVNTSAICHRLFNYYVSVKTQVRQDKSQWSI